MPTLKDYRRTNDRYFCFDNWQWVLPNEVARSSQPGYGIEDGPHTESLQPYIHLLRIEGFGAIISVNEFGVDEACKDALLRAGIVYKHFSTRDMRATDVAQLKEAAETIEAARAINKKSLVFCGYGQGRTGGVIATWALSKFDNAGADAAMDGKTLEERFGVEKPWQCDAVRAAVTGAPIVGAPPGLGALGMSLSGPQGLSPPVGGGLSFPMQSWRPPRNIIHSNPLSGGAVANPPIANFNLNSGLSGIPAPTGVTNLNVSGNSFF